MTQCQVHFKSLAPYFWTWAKVFSLSMKPWMGCLHWLTCINPNMPILVLVLKRSWHIESLQKKAKGKMLTDTYKNLPLLQWSLPHLIWQFILNALPLSSLPISFTLAFTEIYSFPTHVLKHLDNIKLNYTLIVKVHKRVWKQTWLKCTYSTGEHQVS